MDAKSGLTTAAANDEVSASDEHYNEVKDYWICRP